MAIVSHRDKDEPSNGRTGKQIGRQTQHRQIHTGINRHTDRRNCMCSWCLYCEEARNGNRLALVTFSRFFTKPRKYRPRNISSYETTIVSIDRIKSPRREQSSVPGRTTNCLPSNEMSTTSALGCPTTQGQ